MTSERFWIVVLAVTCFLSGGAAGVLVSLDRDSGADRGPFFAYRNRLVQAYDLDEFQAGRLVEILAAYDDRIETLKARQLRDLDDELVKAGEDCMERIHDYIVPAERREEFKLLALGQFGPQTSTP